MSALLLGGLKKNFRLLGWNKKRCSVSTRFSLTVSPSYYKLTSIFVCRRSLTSASDDDQYPDFLSEYGEEVQREDVGYYFEREEGDSRPPWRTILELPARASWRVSDAQPKQIVVETQDSILEDGHISNKQARRALETIIKTHRALANRRQGERRRNVNNEKISKGEIKGDLTMEPIFYGPLETLASLKLRLSPNYAIAKRVLEECKSLLGYTKFGPKRILDFGIGCGSASAAALEVFDNVEWIHGVDPSQCMRDCSKELLEKILQGTQKDAVTRVTLSANISNETASSNFDLVIFAYTATELLSESSILAAAALLWEKLGPNGVFVMIEPGTPDGFNSVRAVRSMLLECCPSLDNDDHDKVSDQSSGDNANEQCHIIAPCTHNGECPMLRYRPGLVTGKNKKSEDSTVYDEKMETIVPEVFQTDTIASNDSPADTFTSLDPGMIQETDWLNNRFCSFVQTVPTGNRLSKGEKISYLVAQKRFPSGQDNDVLRSAEEENPFRDIKVTDLLARFQQNTEVGNNKGKKNSSNPVQEVLMQELNDLENRYLASEDDDLGLELLWGDANRSSFGRIIQAPTKKRGHVYIDYCAQPGRLIRSRITKADQKRAPGIYSAARKTRWGGLWPDVLDGKSNKNNIIK